MKMKKNSNKLEDANTNVITLVITAFAHIFKEAYMHNKGGNEIKSNVFVPQVSTITYELTSKDDDLLSYFDRTNKNNESITSLKKILFDNHTTQANKLKISDQLRINQIFGFCKMFKKITEGLGFHLIFKTADVQFIAYTTLPAITVTNVKKSSTSLFTNVITISGKTSKTQQLYQKDFYLIT